jgi:hypothetical protein
MDKPIATLTLDLFGDGRIRLSRDGVDSEIMFLGLLNKGEDILKKAFAEQQTLIQPAWKVA